jgi:8-oxo-dGTP pyrophosphatase MutT (NUDIX family)
MGYVEELRALVGHRDVILVGVKVLVYDGAGRVLLHRRPSGEWGIPGGLMEPGETAEETGRREVLEETGLRLGKLGLLGVLSGPSQYRKLANGDEFHAVTIVYSAHEVEETVASALPEASETMELRYFEKDEIPEELKSFMIF